MLCAYHAGARPWGRLQEKVTGRLSFAADLFPLVLAVVASSSLVVASSSFTVKIWLTLLSCCPDIDDLRPCRCAGCDAAARPVGEAFVIVGHGTRWRWYVVMTHANPVRIRIRIRRFRCRDCGCVMTVVPSDAAPYRRYTTPVIVYALALWATMSTLQVRARVAVVASDEGSWCQLRRWANAPWLVLGPLPRGSPKERAVAIVQACAGRVPPGAGLSPIDAAVEGATCLMRKL